VSYIDLAEQRIKLLLKKSEGKATESDLKDLFCKILGNFR